MMESQKKPVFSEKDIENLFELATDHTKLCEILDDFIYSSEEITIFRDKLNEYIDIVNKEAGILNILNIPIPNHQKIAAFTGAALMWYLCNAKN